MAAPGRKKGPAPRKRDKLNKPQREAQRAAARNAQQAPGPSLTKQPADTETPQVPRNTLGVLAVVFGCTAVLAAPTIIWGVLLGIPAFVLGVLGRNRANRGEATNKKWAITGMSLGFIGVLISGGLLAYGAYLLSGPAGDRYRECLDRVGSNEPGREECERIFERER